jgi:outer membrane protein
MPPNRLIPIAVAVSTSFSFAGVASAQPGGPPLLTLEAVQRLALARYERIDEARERIAQARLLRRQATAAVLPTVASTSVVTRNFITEAFNFGGRTIEVLPPADYTVALTVSQPLYAGLRDQKARRQADLGIELARERFEATSEDVVLEATRAFYRVLAAEENVAISRRALEVAEESLRTAEALVRAGEAVDTSVLRARVAVMQARRELVQAENSRTLARQELALLTGVEGDFGLLRPPRLAATGLSLDELVRRGLAQRAELQALALEQRIAELELEKRRGQYLPVVRAEGSYIRRRSPFPSPVLSSVAVTATWTLFDGGRTGAEIAAAHSQLRELAARRELLEKQTAQQIRAAYLQVETLAASVDLLEAEVAFARRSAEATRHLYRVGEATDLDLLEANATLTRSERQLALTSYQLDLARYELERAVGGLAADLVRAADAGGDR